MSPEAIKALVIDAFTRGAAATLEDRAVSSRLPEYPTDEQIEAAIDEVCDHDCVQSSIWSEARRLLRIHTHEIAALLGEHGIEASGDEIERELDEEQAAIFGEDVRSEVMAAIVAATDNVHDEIKPSGGDA